MGGFNVVRNKVSLDPLSREQGNETVCFPLEVVNLFCSYELFAKKHEIWWTEIYFVPL